MARPTDGTEPPEPETHRHPDLAAVAGEMRAEWRAEQEAAAADAATQWRHGRGIVDWLRDRMHAGDHVAATVGTERFVGVVEEVGDDLVVLRGAAGLVEIHVCATVPISFVLAEHATEGGTRASERRRFRDALLARDGGPALRLGTVQLDGALEGTLLVARDYVSVVARDGTETAVPLAHVAWVAPART